MNAKEVNQKVNEFIDKQEVSLYMIVTVYLAKGQEMWEKNSAEFIEYCYDSGKYDGDRFFTPDYLRNVYLGVVELAHLDYIVRLAILAKVLRNMK